jgi:branched-chain amino acid transport system substrate-binding protein
MRAIRTFSLVVFAATSLWAQDVIKIGAVMPLTGKESKIGGAYKAATEYAVKEVNDAGGLQVGKKKMKVELLLLDDTTDPSKSAQLVEQLINQDKVTAIIGGYASHLVQAQSVVPERYHVPYVTGGAGASAIYGRSKWVFGTLSPVEKLAETQMEFLNLLQKQKKLKTPLKIVLLKENTEHGRDFEKGVKDFAKAHPKEFSVILDESFELNAPDFHPLLSRVENAHGDVFMCDAHLEDYIAMHRTYTQMGLHHDMVTYGARGADDAARKALGPATDYVFASGWWSALLPYPQVKAFNEKYQKATGSAPQWYHAAAYETARALFTAIHNAGSLNADAIRNALAKVDLKDSILPGGELKFSPTGEAVLPFVVTQNKPGGKLDLVWPAGAKTGEAVAPIPK